MEALIASIGRNKTFAFVVFKKFQWTAVVGGVAQDLCEWSTGVTAELGGGPGGPAAASAVAAAAASPSFGEFDLPAASSNPRLARAIYGQHAFVSCHRCPQMAKLDMLPKGSPRQAACAVLDDAGPNGFFNTWTHTDTAHTPASKTQGRRGKERLSGQHKVLEWFDWLSHQCFRIEVYDLLIVSHKFLLFSWEKQKDWAQMYLYTLWTLKPSPTPLVSFVNRKYLVGVMKLSISLPELYHLSLGRATRWCSKAQYNI